MDKEVSIVLSTENKNYRKLAQRHYGLTDEQMKGMDVHHNPARHEGGRDIPEHLFVYHETLHAAVHGNDFTQWARKGGKKGGKASADVLTPEERSERAKKASMAAYAKLTPSERSERAKKGGEANYANSTLEEWSERGRKGAKALNKDKDKEGKSINAVKGGIAATAERSENGKSTHAIKMGRASWGSVTPEEWSARGRKGGKAAMSDKGVDGKSTHAVKNGKMTSSQKWEDPDHPELGKLAAGPLACRQKARGLPHGPENRRRVR